MTPPMTPSPYADLPHAPVISRLPDAEYVALRKRARTRRSWLIGSSAVTAAGALAVVGTTVAITLAGQAPVEGFAAGAETTAALEAPVVQWVTADVADQAEGALRGAHAKIDTSALKGYLAALDSGRDPSLGLAADAAAEAAEVAQRSAEATEADRRVAEEARKAAEAEEAERARRDAEQLAAVNSPDGAQAFARTMSSERFGWGEGEFGCLVSLWNKESRWDFQAENPSSGAYGIPQSLPGSKMASVADDWATNAATQIEWGLGYIASVYGSPCAAWSHSEAVNWY